MGLSFARLLIEVEIDAKLPDKVFFKNEKGMLVEQKMQYDWKTTLCKFVINKDMISRTVGKIWTLACTQFLAVT